MLVRLLGPFVATVGQPTTLCWRLERAAPTAAAGGGGGMPAPEQQQQQQLAPAQRVGFEVTSESEAWRPVGRRHGGVTLAGHAGAVATVEATWVPLAAGSLPVPALSLLDVSFQVGCCWHGCLYGASTHLEAGMGARPSLQPFTCPGPTTLCSCPCPDADADATSDPTLAKQEVYDVGLSLSGTSAITVVEAAS